MGSVGLMDLVVIEPGRNSESLFFERFLSFFYHHPHFGKIFIQYVDKEQFVALRMNGTTAAKPTCWTRIELQMLT